MSNTVLAELKDGILLLTLNRPRRRTRSTWNSGRLFATELDAARKDDDINGGRYHRCGQ